MPEFLRAWILSLAGAAVFCAVMTELCPKGPVKSVVKALCGMVMALALISPLLNLDIESYSVNLARYRLMGEEAAMEGKNSADRYSRTIIESRCRAYILDKAAALGAGIDDASVTLRWSSEGFWYPVECEIVGQRSAELASAIESGLGIGPEGQKWRSDEGA